MAERYIYASTVLLQYHISLEFGLSPAEIESHTGLTAASLAQPEATASGSAVYGHLELVARQCDLGAFLIALAEAHTLSTLGVVGFAAKSCRHFAEALECFRRYQHLTNELASFKVESSEQELCLVEQRWGEQRLGSLLATDVSLLIAVQIARQVSGQRIVPTRVSSVRCDVPEQAHLERFLGTAIDTERACGEVAFEPRLAGLQLNTADPDMLAYFKRQLDQAMVSDSGDSFRFQVNKAIARRLHHGTPSVMEISKSLGVSARTLQRRLQQEQLNFATLTEAVRKQLVRQYLKDPKKTVADTAYLLGYTDKASFYRAFRRWYGQTPTSLRSQLLAESSGAS